MSVRNNSTVILARFLVLCDLVLYKLFINFEGHGVEHLLFANFEGGREGPVDEALDVFETKRARASEERCDLVRRVYRLVTKRVGVI